MKKAAESSGLESEICEFLVHLAEAALRNKPDEVLAYVRRAARRLSKEHGDVSGKLQELLEVQGKSAGVVREVPIAEFRSQGPLPVDSDSRLELLRREDPVVLDNPPIFGQTIQSKLESVVFERANTERLAKAGLQPSKSLLLTGPPGVGKTFSARWLAHSLGLPLLTLDLSAVMSSFLGRTGNNLRIVLDYARSSPCVMLLDEFDACAKRRDDATEIGELKRLVTVLLQAVDDWPPSGLLIAATNHPDLLDPAVWRRFEHVLEFPYPDVNQVEQAIACFLGDHKPTREWMMLLCEVFKGRSIADIKGAITSVKRQAFLADSSIDVSISTSIESFIHKLQHKDRRRIANSLKKFGLSDRKISSMTRVSRDTIRKYRSQ